MIGTHTHTRKIVCLFHITSTVSHISSAASLFMHKRSSKALHQVVEQICCVDTLFAQKIDANRWLINLISYRTDLITATLSLNKSRGNFCAGFTVSRCVKWRLATTHTHSHPSIQNGTDLCRMKKISNIFNWT